MCLRKRARERVCVRVPTLNIWDILQIGYCSISKIEWICIENSTSTDLLSVLLA